MPYFRRSYQSWYCAIKFLHLTSDRREEQGRKAKFPSPFLVLGGCENQHLHLTIGVDLIYSVWQTTKSMESARCLWKLRGWIGFVLILTRGVHRRESAETPTKQKLSCTRRDDYRDVMRYITAAVDLKWALKPTDAKAKARIWHSAWNRADLWIQDVKIFSHPLLKKSWHELNGFQFNKTSEAAR